ncbi:Hypothetical predicted protein, partial [Pelobates cultripes]
MPHSNTQTELDHLYYSWIMINKRIIDKKRVAERILNHALGIIYLLTGEEYVVIKKTSPSSSIHLATGE